MLQLHARMETMTLQPNIQRLKALMTATPRGPSAGPSLWTCPTYHAQRTSAAHLSNGTKHGASGALLVRRSVLRLARFLFMFMFHFGQQVIVYCVKSL